MKASEFIDSCANAHPLYYVILDDSQRYPKGLPIMVANGPGIEFDNRSAAATVATALQMCLDRDVLNEVTFTCKNKEYCPAAAWVRSVCRSVKELQRAGHSGRDIGILCNHARRAELISSMISPTNVLLMSTVHKTLSDKVYVFAKNNESFHTVHLNDLKWNSHNSARVGCSLVPAYSIKSHIEKSTCIVLQP